MNSCLYKTQVFHKRLSPKKHEFSYNQFMFGIDLDELVRIHNNLNFVGINRPNLFSFYSRDHFQYGKLDLKENITAFLKEKHNVHEIGNIFIITQLKMWGFLFNPVSFFFIRDLNNQPLGIVAEVMNTFREFKLYFISADKKVGNTYKDEQDKLFYISPFSELNTKLLFDIQEREDTIDIQVNEKKIEDSAPFFFSRLKGEKSVLNDRTLLKFALRFPSNTFLSFLQIHLQALALFRKKTPWFRKSDHPHLQTDTQKQQSPKEGRPL